MNLTAIRALTTSLDLAGQAQRLEREASAFGATENPLLGNGPVQVYHRSITYLGDLTVLLVRDAGASTRETRRLFVALAATTPALGVLAGLTLETDERDGLWIGVAHTTTANAKALHRLLAWTAPVSLRERRTTIGMGDRLGVATAGHIRAARQYDVAPVLAQQSVRENDFIGRTFDDVVANATWSVLQEGYRDGYGADGDHLKAIPAIDVALTAGMPMITLDLTEVMKPEVADWSDSEVAGAFAELPDEVRARIEQDYAARPYVLGQSTNDSGTTVTLTAAEARRCAVMYGPALDFSSEVDAHLHAATDGAYDLEISIDETTTPTLPAHHLFIARELQVRGVTVNSLAPRFIGEFQKAVDYQGDLGEFEKQFRVHCLIARSFGNYKISVHSGSDKFAVYPIVGRETAMRLHLKTSGTSWLEALRTIAVHDPALYRRIHSYVVGYYPTALAFYHIGADFASIAPLERVPDDQLASYLDDPDARQMLHISYGGVLCHDELGPALYEALHRLEEEYSTMIVAHFTKHIGLLGAAGR